MKAVWKKCRTPRCRNRLDPIRCRRPICAKCSYRKFSAEHPVECAFNNMRKRAKQRGHEFSVPLEIFRKLVTDSGWLEKRGKTAKSLSVDRIDSSRGYVEGNLRVLTLAQNSRLKYAPLPGWMRAELEQHEKHEPQQQSSGQG